MKKIVYLFLALGFLTALSASAQQKIVTFSMRDSMQKYYKAISFAERLESRNAALEEEIKVKGTGLQAKYDAMNARFGEISENPGLTDEAKKTQVKALDPEVQALEKEKAAFEKWRSESIQTLRGEAANTQGEIIKEIRKVATAVALEQGATIVLDSSEPAGVGAPVVLYADPRLEITDLVLRELNKNAPNN